MRCYIKNQKPIPSPNNPKPYGFPINSSFSLYSPHRYDEEKDKYYLINNATGQMLRVHKTGDFIKEFDASLTGAVDYNERVGRAQKVSLKYLTMNKISKIDGF